MAEFGEVSVSLLCVKMMERTIDEVLDRAAQGIATEGDAHLLRCWLFPDERARIIEAYLTLSGNMDAARRHIEKDLRVELAERLKREV